MRGAAPQDGGVALRAGLGARRRRQTEKKEMAAARAGETRRDIQTALRSTQSMSFIIIRTSDNAPPLYVRDTDVQDYSMPLMPVPGIECIGCLC